MKNVLRSRREPGSIRAPVLTKQPARQIHFQKLLSFQVPPRSLRSTGTQYATCTRVSEFCVHQRYVHKWSGHMYTEQPIHILHSICTHTSASCVHACDMYTTAPAYIGHSICTHISYFCVLQSMLCYSRIIKFKYLCLRSMNSASSECSPGSMQLLKAVNSPAVSVMFKTLLLLGPV